MLIQVNIPEIVVVAGMTAAIWACQPKTGLDDAFIQFAQFLVDLLNVG